MGKFLSVIVNTTDSFEDCWQPFFLLFLKYWPEFKGEIFLNTEAKNFLFSGLSITSVKNNNELHLKNISWSESLQHALNSIDSEIILYLQEDYFIRERVNDKDISEFVKLMQTSPEIDCIHLTDQSTPGPFLKSSYNKLWEIKKNATYRISTQAALWKKSALEKYLIPGEDPWEFEHNGTNRSKHINDLILCVDRNIYRKNYNEIIPYIFTGILKGKWNKEVELLFKKENININFSTRGFYQKYNLYERIFNKLFSNINRNKV